MVALDRLSSVEATKVEEDDDDEDEDEGGCSVFPDTSARPVRSFFPATSASFLPNG